MTAVHLKPVSQDLTAGSASFADRVKSHELEKICSQKSVPVAARRARTGPVASKRDSGVSCQGLSDWQVKTTMFYIEKNLQRPIRLSEVASAVNRSVSYFSVGFRKSFGLAPYAYILGRRIERAKAILTQTDDRLCDVALECGLSDQAHLSRIFKHLVGTSPGSWRRGQRNQIVS